VNSPIASDQLSLGLIDELLQHGTGIMTGFRVQNPDQDRDVRLSFARTVEALVTSNLVVHSAVQSVCIEHRFPPLTGHQELTS